MKYFLDTEFLEGTQERPLLLKGRLGNLIIGYPQPTIDLISIGIISEDNRTYYAVSKDFNLKEAWNRYDIEKGGTNAGIIETKVYWIRENVLRPIFYELVKADVEWHKNIWRTVPGSAITYHPKNHIFTYKNFKKLRDKYGTSRKELQREIIEFVTPTNEPHFCKTEDGKWDITYQATKRGGSLPEFYGYYSDYDWVVFCWIFGKMIDLPKGFPMYCIDLKQELDRISDLQWDTVETGECRENRLNLLKAREDYPKHKNEHNALADAKWTKELYDFLQAI